MAKIVAMCDAVHHRGPDGEGYAVLVGDEVRRLRRPGSADVGLSRLALGHRRLAIIDLTEAASQPMSYGLEQRYWITYNGEIYNFPEIRKDLADLGFGMHSGSDTEVILAAYAAWGTSCLSRFNGMFAFFLFDRLDRTFFVARDRFGVKPLYWWRSADGTTAFASEIKQFTVLKEWTANLNGPRAYDYLNWGLTDHTDETLFRDVFQIPGGHFVEMPIAQIGGSMPIKRWYGVKTTVSVATFESASSRFREIFLDSVRLRLRADVEVGTALSGGLDSSSIVCAADHLREDRAESPIHTFSARAMDAAFDEGRFIKAVINATRTVPHVVYPDPDELFADLERLVWHHDEPFGSTSVFAEWQVFRLVQKACIKVTLDGHGADETLAGYTSFLGPHLAALLNRGEAVALLREVCAQRRLHRRPYSFLAAILADHLLPQVLRDILRRLTGRTVQCPDWMNLDRLGTPPNDPFAAIARRYELGVNGLSMAQLTAVSLPMQLKWADRCSMAHSVESRAPFLDYRLVDHTISMPPAYKLQNGITKRVLREAMKGILPSVIGERRDKMGFVTPEELWVRRDRPDRFRAALQDAIGVAGGVLTPRALEIGNAMIDGHLPYHNRLWRMICFGAWIRRFQVDTGQ